MTPVLNMNMMVTSFTASCLNVPLLHPATQCPSCNVMPFSLMFCCCAWHFKSPAIAQHQEMSTQNSRVPDTTPCEHSPCYNSFRCTAFEIISHHQKLLRAPILRKLSLLRNVVYQSVTFIYLHTKHPCNLCNHDCELKNCISWHLSILQTCLQYISSSQSRFLKSLIMNLLYLLANISCDNAAVHICQYIFRTLVGGSHGTSLNQDMFG